MTGGGAQRYPEYGDRTKASMDDTTDLYSLLRTIAFSPTRIQAPSFGSGSAAPVGGTGFLKTEGDTMMGPIAFSPRDAAIDANGRIDISESTASDYSTYVLVTPIGSPDTLRIIEGAGFNGQYLILQGTAASTINIQHAKLRSISNIVGTTTVTVTTTAAHGYTTGDLINIVGTVNFDIQDASITVTGGSTFTYAAAGSLSAESTGTAQDGNIVTADGTDVNLVGGSDNDVPIANFIFDVTVAGFGAWRYVGGSGSGGGSGTEIFTWSANHDANGFSLEAPVFADATTPTKRVAFDISGASVSTTTTLTFAQTLNSILTFPSISAGTIPYLERTQTWTGINVFQADASDAGLNVSLKVDPDPTSGGNGDIYYNITNDKFRGFENGAWVDMIGGGGEVFTWTADHDANGNALIEFRHADPVDPTKQVKILNSGASPSTNTSLVFAQTLNSTLTFPSISVGTIPYLERTQTWTGHNVYTADASDTGFQVASKLDPEPTGANGQIYFNTSDNKLRAFQQGVWFDVLGGVGNEVFTWSQNHDANGFALEAPRFADPTVNTKNVAFDISGASVSTTTTLTFAQTLNSVLTFPSISAGTIPYLERTQTWTGHNVFTPGASLAGLNMGLKVDPDPSGGSNGDLYFNITDTKARVFQNGWVDIIQEEFSDSIFRIIDDIDPTRKLAFQTGGITTATTRTLTIDDHDGTIITDTGAQTLTGTKTFDGTANVIVITGTGAYINMNAHPIEFQDMTNTAVGGVGTGERRLFNDTDNNNKLSVKRPDGVSIASEGYRHGTIPQTANAYFSLQKHGDGLGAAAQTVNEMVAIPFIPNEDCTITHIGLHIGTAGSSNADVIVGIYANSPGTDDGNYPTLKIQQTGAIDTTVTGNNTAALTSSQTLAGGVLYWIVFNQQNGATEPLITEYDGNLMTIPDIGILSTDADSFNISTNDQAWGWRVSSTYSTTMPTFPGSGTKQQQLQDAPAIFVRCTVP